MLSQKIYNNSPQLRQLIKEAIWLVVRSTA